MIGAMRRSSFSPISLLRYAGLITYASAGVPLVRRNWIETGAERTAIHATRALHAESHNVLLLWAISYVVFGVVYWLLTRDLASRRHWSMKLFGLLVLTATAFATIGLSVS
jgi:hypothetical protein